MMRIDGRTGGLRSARGLLSAALLAIAGLAVAWLCVRTAIVEALPADSANVAQIAPHAPTVVLEKAAAALVRQHGIVSPDTLAAVRRAAAAAPLDARAYLVIGHQRLLDDQPAQALATLEAGQRLDPRQRVIHLLLLDRYLKTGHYAQAGDQLSVLARLVGAAGGPIAAAMAQMSLAPETRDAVRRTLAADPALEQQVLVALARSDTPPAAIFALATPAGRQAAGASDGWGPALIQRLVAKGQFAEARSVWQQVYRLPAVAVTAPIYDAGFRTLPGSPPFNWTLTAGSLGAADIRNGTMNIDYYGRDSGDLASQLLVLPAGSYRFAFTVEGGKAAAGPTLAWVLHCATGSKAELMNATVTATGTRHREVAAITVPTECPAQLLTLGAIAGEFPVPINVTIQDLALQPAAAGPATGGRP